MVSSVEADAIVVLGCRIGPDGRPGPAAQRRCCIASCAFGNGAAPWILVSGGAHWFGTSEAEAMAGELVRMGVSRRVLALEHASTNTFENAWFSAALLRARQAKRVVLVTCDYHARRASWQFRRLGLDVTVLGAPTPGLTPWRRGVLGARELASLLLQAPLETVWEL